MKKLERRWIPLHSRACEILLLVTFQLETHCKPADLKNQKHFVPQWSHYFEVK